MGNTTWDIGLFEALNFNGGSTLDWLMTHISGMAMWVPLYLLIIYMVWRRYSWFGVATLIVAVAVAMGMADIIAGIFKHSGPLKHLWPDFPVRLRPMFTESLGDIHVVTTQGHGLFGTVSAHAATIVSLTIISCLVIRRRWFTIMMVVCAVLICYSRIYLACHFPQDILIGALLGLASGYAGLKLFRWMMRLREGVRK
ncbi:MAG: phosphatase PAP2 family protein [Alistipes sp.]|nr:phosphatase PAP2 family protein [Alistipes sp.]